MENYKDYRVAFSTENRDVIVYEKSQEEYFIVNKGRTRTAYSLDQAYQIFTLELLAEFDRFSEEVQIILEIFKEEKETKESVQKWAKRKWERVYEKN